MANPAPIRLRGRASLASEQVGDHPTLPKPVSTLMGRDLEIGRLATMLEGDAGRLFTLAGPGGVGKTRVALAAAERAGVFGPRRWFVSFAATLDPALVAGAIASGVGARGGTVEAAAAWLGRALERRRGLLILDNMEHVLEAAAVIPPLLAASPNLTVLVTSRRVLHLPGETIVDLEPLALPPDGPGASPEAILASDAVRLLLARAREAGATFDTPAEMAETCGAICRQLDGLPLAIELAAPWLRMLPPRALLERLSRPLPMLERGARNAPPRQRGMRSTIAWSHELLDPEAQWLFRRLAVFTGGFTRDGFESVVLGDAPRPDWLYDRLDTLIDHNLVRRLSPSFGAAEAGPRLILLGVVREYALERLAAAGESDALRDRHAAWCQAIATAAIAERTRAETAGACARLTAERYNVRAALGWLEASGQPERALELAATLWPLWLEQGALVEGHERLERLLASVTAPIAPATHATALGTLAALLQAHGDHEAACRRAVAALRHFEALGDAGGAGAALTTLGLDAMVVGDLSTAETHLTAALERFTAGNDRRAGSWALRHLASVAYRRGDIAASERLARQGLEIVLPSGSAQDIARLRASIALAAMCRGNLEEAERAYHNSLALYRSANDRWGEADVLQRLAYLAFLRGDDTLADELLSASAELLESVGDPEGLARLRSLEGWIARRHGHLDRAADRFTTELAIARQHDLRRSAASALLGLGVLALDRGELSAAATTLREALHLMIDVDDPLGIAATLDTIAALASDPVLRAAAGLLGAADARRAASGVPIERPWVAARGLLARGIRERLGDAPYAAAHVTGQRWDIDQAAEAARTVLAAASVPHAGAITIGVPHDLEGVLSSREIQVMRLIAEGCSDRQIADALGISRRTATTHVGHIFTKLGVSSRTAAAAHAVRAGIV